MSENNIAIAIKDISKTFRIPLESTSGLKQKLINTLKGKKGYREFTPLKDLSFDIEKGDFFGIVGRNGSGKSTLLKTIANIYEPTTGSVTVEGTLVPFIELGVGFNQELTGRENVFLNGALLGFSHTDMKDMYDDIVEFAELAEFMDERLKNYSSGMQVRLAFSIAVRARADILLLDEVLAVGDEAFQKKCFAYFDQLKREKKTVVLVTHDMAAVERFCNKAVFIEEGKVKVIGKPYIVAAAYSKSNDASYEIDSIEKPEDPFSIELFDQNGNKSNKYDYLDQMVVRVNWEQDNVKDVGVAIFRENGEFVFGTNTYQDKFKGITNKSIEYTVTLNLNEGNYFVRSGLTGKNDLDTIAYIGDGPHFTVKRDYTGGRWIGLTKLPYSWQIQNSTEEKE